MLVLYVLMVYIRGAVHIQIAPLVIVIAPLGGPRSPILMSESDMRIVGGTGGMPPEPRAGK